MRFIYFDELDPVPEADPGVFAGEDSEQDYSQLIYDYLVSKEDVNYKTELQEVNDNLTVINKNLEWINALLLLMVTLYLFNYARRWVSKLTGGLNDVS